MDCLWIGKEAMGICPGLEYRIERSTAQQTCHFLRLFLPPTFTASILSAMFTGACGPPEKLSPRFGAALIRSAHDCATRLFHVLVFILDPRPTNATPVVTLVFASYSTFKTTFIIGSCHIYGTIVQCNRCSTILEFYIFIINLKIM